MFGLPALPLTASDGHKLEAVQRRMLRSIVGWVRIAGEEWRTTMQRMSGRVEAALKVHHVVCWGKRLSGLQYDLACHLGQKPDSWAFRASSWQLPDTWPFARRPRSRPPTRWDDRFETFSQVVFGESWVVAARDKRRWQTYKNEFIEYACECE